MARRTAAVPERLPAPKAGVRPDMSGVPGEIVSLDGLELYWGGRRKISPYDVLLDQLAKATDEALDKQQPRPGLKFGVARAKAAVYARAKAKGLKISFAEMGGALYVRMEGRVEDDTRNTRRGRIAKLLVAGVALSSIQIAAKLREMGDGTMDAQIADAILAQMMRSGDVIKQEGGAWKSAPLKRAVA